jgi:ribonuclease HI
MAKQPDFYLFTDGSADTINKVGVGAYLLLSSLIDSPKQEVVKTKKFKNTSSTKLEIETLIWALT